MKIVTKGALINCVVYMCINRSRNHTEMGIHHIIDENDYEKHLESSGSKLIVIEFFATWCGHCTMLAPVIKNLSDELADKVVFLKVNVEENEDMAKNENVMGTPTFVLYKNKKRLNATSNEAKLKEMISKFK